VILHSLRLKGLSSAFATREVALDFDAGLVALVGENGSGKTTCLESSGPAVLYREFPSYQESFADHVAPGVRDAFAELTFSLDARYVARLQADPQFGGGRGKTEGYLTRNGVALAGPLVREYDEAIAKILPPRELFLASVFACQGGDGSFFNLPKAARKDLFSRLLGLDHLQTLSEAARERARAELTRIESVRREIEGAERSVARRTEVCEALDALAPRLTDAENTVHRAELAVEEHRQGLAAAREAAAAAQAIENARWALAEKIAELKEQQAATDALLADADTVRAAVSRLAEIDTALAIARDAERAATAGLPALEGRRATLAAELAALRERHGAVSNRLRDAAVAAARVAAAGNVAGRVATARAELDRLETATTAAATALPGLEVAARDEATRGATRQRLLDRQADLTPRTGLLAQIPGVPECATCPLTADARQAVEALQEVEAELDRLPAVDGTPAADALAAHRRAQQVLEGQRTAVHRALVDAERTVAELAADHALADSGQALETERDAIVAEGTTKREAADQVERELAEATARAGACADERNQLEFDRAQFAERAGRLTEIVQAEARREEVIKALAGLCFGPEERLPDLPDLPMYVTAVESARTALLEATDAATFATIALQSLTEERARWEGERDAIGDADRALAELHEREATLVRDASDWALLERGLGRDGVIALELDAAGPTVGTLANDLLASCYGPRFQLAIETTAMTKDGKKQREVFDVRILDSEAGREAKRCSGGETVLIEEALRLALALFNAERSGVPLRTLWRDETVGALSPANANAYIAMLRRAMEIGRFHTCLFIAHQPDVWQQADAQLFVQDGQVTVGVPASEAA
jgi:exonuclease SbcC